MHGGTDTRTLTWWDSQTDRQTTRWDIARYETDRQRGGTLPGMTDTRTLALYPFLLTAKNKRIDGKRS